MSEHERDGTGASARSDAADAGLVHAWRDASDEQPARELDAAIIAAARDAVSPARGPTSVAAAPRSRGSRSFPQWQAFAAAASVAGLAFVLVQMLPRGSSLSSPDPGRPQPSSSAEIAVPAPAGNPATRLTEEPAQAAAESNVPRELERRGAYAPPLRRVEPAPAVGSAAPQQVDAPDRGAAGVTDATTTEAVLPAAPQSGSEGALKAQMETAAPAAAARTRADAVLRPDPAEWADRIAALHAAGDLTAAATSLRDFRAAYEGADSYLTPSLQDWARAVD